MMSAANSANRKGAKTQRERKEKRRKEMTGMRCARTLATRVSLRQHVFQEFIPSPVFDFAFLAFPLRLRAFAVKGWV